MPRGGKREGAGRPCAGTAPVKVRLTEHQRVLFQCFGGTKWLREKINEEETKMTKFENLTRGAKFIIADLFGDGPLTRGAALNALEGVKADEDSIKAAREYIESIAGETLAFYVVNSAFQNADPLPGDGSIYDKVIGCYEDDIDLGLFATDEEAIAAAEIRQAADDEKAKKVLGETPLEGGPSYCNNVFKYSVDGLERVEC